MRRVFREVYGSNLVAAFRKHRDAGKLEIITCGATHGFFPLMDPVPQAVRAQVQVAAAALPQALRPRRRRASGCPSAATCPATRCSCARPGIRFAFVESPRPHRRAPASELRRPRADRLARRRRLLRARHGVLAPGVERGVRLPGRLRLPRVLQGRRLGAAARLPRGLPARRRSGRTSASSTTASRGAAPTSAHKQPYVRAWAMEKAASHAGNFLAQPQRAGASTWPGSTAARRSW